MYTHTHAHIYICIYILFYPSHIYVYTPLIALSLLQFPSITLSTLAKIPQKEFLPHINVLLQNKKFLQNVRDFLEKVPCFFLSQTKTKKCKWKILVPIVSTSPTFCQLIIQKVGKLFFFFLTKAFNLISLCFELIFIQFSLENCKI